MKTSLRISAACLITAVFPAYADPPGGVDRIDSPTDRVPVQTVIPDYPPVARRDRIEGSVQVCFNISRAGKPRRIAVRHSTSGLFEKAAMQAVRRSTWKPLAAGEELTGIKSCRTFRFSLVPASDAPDQS